MKRGFAQQEYDADYLEEVRAKEKHLEKERRRGEREAEREQRRASRHAERDERKRMSEMEQSQGEQTDRERRREERRETERERRRKEKRRLRRAEKAEEKERERQRQLAIAQEQAEAEEQEQRRDLEREKQRERRREQRETQSRQPREPHQVYEDDYGYASSPVTRTPHKSKWWDGAAYGEVRNESSPRGKYFEKSASPNKKSRVISGPYLEDQHDEVYEYRKDKLEGSSQASDYTSTTVWKTKRNKRICKFRSINNFIHQTNSRKAFMSAYLL